MKHFVRIAALTLMVGSLLVAGPLAAQDVDWSKVKKTWDTLTPDEQATYQRMLAEMDVDKAPASAPVATILGQRVLPSRVATDQCGTSGYEMGMLPFSDVNITTGATDDYQLTADCGGATAEPFTGEDLTYLVQVDQTCDIFGTVTNDDYDSVLYVLTDCATQTCIAGGDDPEDLTFTATAGTDYWVVVDGWNGQDGNYELTLSEVTATGCMLVPVELQSFSID